MKTINALGSGLAGACAVSLIHKAVNKIVPEAPHPDLLGMNVISKGLHLARAKTPEQRKVFAWALVGDLAANTLYYSMAGFGKEKNIWLKSSVLGLTAGLCAVAFSEPLTKKHIGKTATTKFMTVGLYVAGALITTAVMKLLEKKKQKKNKIWEKRLVTSAMG